MSMIPLINPKQPPKKGSAMYRKGYDCGAISFSYIPDFKSKKEKEECELGYKDGIKTRKNKRQYAPYLKNIHNEIEKIETKYSGNNALIYSALENLALKSFPSSPEQKEVIKVLNEYRKPKNRMKKYENSKRRKNIRPKRKQSKIYVGVKTGGKREVFRSTVTPTRETHGREYDYAIGPFRTKEGAAAMAVYGRGNPHIQTVSDAERLALQWKKEKGRR